MILVSRNIKYMQIFTGVPSARGLILFSGHSYIGRIARWSLR